jgi:hypothetical protein
MSRTGEAKSLKVEVNSKFVEANTTLKLGDGMLAVTPPLNDGYWMMRVPLSKNQAIVCFPKFFTIGIGFQREKDWNTNLPYTQPAEDIFDHIAHNKGDKSIADADCIEAIRLLQSAIARTTGKE